VNRLLDSQMWSLETLQHKQREQWLQENQSAIDAYNSMVEEQGAFSDDIRCF
jgi:antitoxin CcdA